MINQKKNEATDQINSFGSIGPISPSSPFTSPSLPSNDFIPLLKYQDIWKGNFYLKKDNLKITGLFATFSKTNPTIYESKILFWSDFYMDHLKEFYLKSFFVLERGNYKIFKRGLLIPKLGCFL